MKSKTMKKAVAEFRADGIKTLEEKRGALVADMQAIIDGAKAEVRAFSEEEQSRMKEIESEIRAIDGTLEAERRALPLMEAPKADADAQEKTDTKQGEVRAFADYIRANAGGQPSAEYRAGEQNITMGNNGAVIPQSIAQQIITTVQEMCPILQGVTMFAVKGTLKVPVWGKANTTHDISVGFQEEFTELTADSGKFTSIDLTGYLAGCLVLVGKSVINNSDIDVVSFVVNEMSKKIALFLEKCLLVPSTSVNSDGATVSGALATTTSVTAASAAVITADELIELQSKVPTAYQANACWTMNPATFTAIRKLKDSTGQYLLQTTANIVNGFPYMLLGKPVYISDNMPTIEASAAVVLYGDYSGMAMNFRQQIDMQVLNEKYATQHAVGLCAWFEFDCKVIDNQKLAKLVMKSS